MSITCVILLTMCRLVIARLWRDNVEFLAVLRLAGCKNRRAGWNSTACDGGDAVLTAKWLQGCDAKC